MQIWPLLQPQSWLLQFNSYNFPRGLLCAILLCIFGSDWGPSHLSWLCSVDSGSKLVLSEADTQSCAGCAVAWYAQAHVCVCACGHGVAVGGTSSYSSAVEEFPWAILPGATVWPERAEPGPVSSARRHAHSPSAETAELHPPLLGPRWTEPDSRTGREDDDDHDEKWGKRKTNGILKSGFHEGQRMCCLQTPKLCEGVMHRFCRKEERDNIHWTFTFLWTKWGRDSPHRAATTRFFRRTLTFGRAGSLFCHHDSQHAQVHPAARAQPREHAVSRAEEAVEIFPLQEVQPGGKPPAQRVRASSRPEHREGGRWGDAHHPRAVPPLHRIAAASGAFVFQ